MKLKYFLLKHTGISDMTQLRFSDVSRTVPIFLQIEEDIFLLTRTGIPYRTGKSPDLSCLKKQAIDLELEADNISEYKHLKYSLYNSTTKRIVSINNKKGTDELDIEEAINISVADKVSRWRITSIPNNLKAPVSLISKISSGLVCVDSLQDLAAKGYEIHDKGILWFVILNGDVYFMLTCTKSA